MQTGMNIRLFIIRLSNFSLGTLNSLVRPNHCWASLLVWFLFLKNAFTEVLWFYDVYSCGGWEGCAVRPPQDCRVVVLFSFVYHDVGPARSSGITQRLVQIAESLILPQNNWSRMYLLISTGGLSVWWSLRCTILHCLVHFLQELHGNPFGIYPSG